MKIFVNTIFALTFAGVMPAIAAESAPFPPERPGAQFGEMILSIGPGVQVDTVGIHVDCEHPAPMVNVMSSDGELRATIPVKCS